MGAASSTVQIDIARLPAAEGLPLPSRATSESAGYDLCAAVQHDLVLRPGDRALVPTGYRIAIPPGYEGQIRPRSGLALSHGILVPNAPGTIDSDYRGELRVILLNAGEKPYSIRRGDRIAQLVIAPVTSAEFCECDQLEPADR
ncbi:MAG: dUTP diphosphatase, partial [Myxococcales bacterium]|nr:dUTP diphosphatase [Myxococcales bacterium]